MTHGDQKYIFSFHGLVRWSAFLQSIYKIQEMLHVNTRHKIFLLLTEEQQGDRETSGRPVTTFPKDAHPQEWQWKPGSKLPLQFFLVVLKYKHFLTFPSQAHEPTTRRRSRIQAQVLLLSFPLRIIYRMPTDTVQTSTKLMIVAFPTCFCG